jgi:hypothetical protein
MLGRISARRFNQILLMKSAASTKLKKGPASTTMLVITASKKKTAKKKTVPLKRVPAKKKVAVKTSDKKKELKKDVAASYNHWKIYQGTQYTGMKIGRSLKWYYDKGVWKDKKITPDMWEIDYSVIKRRAGHAPEGSGVPVGTEYHWFILAHQHVRKLNADDYTTTMNGLKFKLAHKRYDKPNWSASDKAQRKKLIKILKQHIAQLEKELEEDEK